ncbi:hypothetical protein LMG29542_04364 [Paraburkholderia humisilvae]|uniref:Uncharacterized protein n=1 Tax=Paraburkholderia humisilvae TaxID=627669 RepID=A0A6J5E7W7_9BURK|nr:hypothetical protein LMG29542_04364 [Paraburkholderia humisilvae]
MQALLESPAPNNRKANMGIQDRDWYRDELNRREGYRPSRHQPVHPALRHLHTGRSTPKFVIALAWVGVGALLYIAFTVLQHYHR